MVTGPRLTVRPDPAVWFVGPDEERPFEVWLPEAVELLKSVFGVGRRQTEVEHYLTLMLERIGRPSDGPLPYRLVRWLDVAELPVVASFGMVPREDDLHEFLSVGDPSTVETPIVEDVPAPAGTTVRRAVSYSSDEAGLLVEVRYVVDTGDDEAVMLVLAGDRRPGAIVSVVDDLDAFALSAAIERG